MPYKRIVDRRAAWRRWAAKHLSDDIVKEKRRSRDMALKITRKKCSIFRCEGLGERHHGDYSKPLEVISLCKKHHEVVHHNRKCTECGDKHRARGLCNKHWKQWRKGKLNPRPAY